jgi:glycosyltransferase involved in cell wall biosynthesis
MEPLRIVQLIDSLDLGGAERMAVNYANALATRVAFSGLVATRKEGLLKDALDARVHYLFIERTKKIDWGAIVRLNNFCKKHQITHIHAHGTSFFSAVLVKILRPSIKIVWHDHNGNRASHSMVQNKVLKICSMFFDGILVVNKGLESWAKQKMTTKSVLFLPNFVVREAATNESILKGNPSKSILCLANFRWQKNQEMLIEVFDSINEAHPDWTLHLVGNGFKSNYGMKLVQLCEEKKLGDKVFFYEGITDIATVINQATIGVLTSVSEGLPMVVLEYGLYNKPVVVTSVGELPLIIQDGINGGLVAPNEPSAFVNKLLKLMDDAEVRKSWGNALQETVTNNYTEAAVMPTYVTWMKQL